MAACNQYSLPGSIASIILALLLIPSFIASSLAAQAGLAEFPDIYPVDSRPFGQSYPEWTASWWQWALTIPERMNPISDTTGQFCNVGQSGPVWFLGGTWGGSVERKCNIPVGKAILWGPINYSCSPVEFPSLKTEDALRDCAKKPMDKVLAVSVKINGTESPDLKQFRIQSPVFNFTFPDGNILGEDVPSQKTFSVSDGYWIFLKPLPKGHYTIESTGTYLSADTSPETPTAFSNTVKYTINIGP
jgi:hypothetical protein